MMIHFRRNALRVTVAALLSSAFGAQAADIPQVKVTVNDKQCEPMQVTVNAGKTQFIIQNHSQKALEWEILKGVMVVEERENTAPGFTQKLTANLQPGEYDMTCGLLTNPKGKLIVTGAATKDAAKADAVLRLGDAITAYKAYVTTETAQLVSGTKAFTDAVKAGDIEKAKALYAPTRQHYERIEPIAELFSDLDGSIDALTFSPRVGYRFSTPSVDALHLPAGKLNLWVGSMYQDVQQEFKGSLSDLSMPSPMLQNMVNLANQDNNGRFDVKQHLQSPWNVLVGAQYELTQNFNITTEFGD